MSPSSFYRHRLLPEGASAFRYEQGIEMGRPSRLRVEVAERPDGSLTVRVGGRVVQVGAGEFQLP